MRAHPRRHLNTTLDQQRRHQRHLSIADVRHAFIAEDPVIHPLRRTRMVLDETDRGRQIVQIPAHAAVVEVDHPGFTFVQQQIGQTQIGVDQAVAIALFTKFRQRLPGAIHRRCDNAVIGRIEMRRILPAPPVAVLADHGVMIPDNTLKTFRFLPAAAVLMQARGDGTELLKGFGIDVGGRHLAVNPVEQHRMTRAAVRQRQRQHAFTVARRDGLRHHDAGLAQRIEPHQFTENIRFAVVIRPVQAQCVAFAAGTQQKGGVLRTAQQLQLTVQRGGIAGQRTLRQQGDLGIGQGFGLFGAHSSLSSISLYKPVLSAWDEVVLTA